MYVFFPTAPARALMDCRTSFQPSMATVLIRMPTIVAPSALLVRNLLRISIFSFAAGTSSLTVSESGSRKDQSVVPHAMRA